MAQEWVESLSTKYDLWLAIALYTAKYCELQKEPSPSKVPEKSISY